MKRAMATAMRVAGDKGVNGKGGNGYGNGNKGVRQGTTMATKCANARATRVAGEKEAMATKRALAMVTATKIAGDNEGNGEGRKVNDNGDKGVVQGMAMATKGAMATARKVAGNKEANGDSNKGGR